MSVDFTDRTVVVTGAAGGIGLGLVRAFHRAGARVAALDRDVRDLQGVSRVWANNDRMLLAAVDVGHWDGVISAAARITDQWGPLEVWVNCAGVFPYARLPDLTPDHVASTLTVNFQGALAGAQAAVPYLIPGFGSILNVSSIAATRARSGRLVYGASKAALEQATRCLAIELAPEQIRVNAVAPGYIDTSMLHWVTRDDEVMARVTREVPIGRLGRVEDVVSAALYLSSRAASYVTGVVLPVDGGLRAGGTGTG